MSDDTKKDFMDDLARAALLEKKKAELQADELEIKAYKIETQKQRIAESQKNLELAKNTSFGMLSDTEIDKMIKDSEEYIDAAKEGMSFIDPQTFKGVIPFFRKNLILIGAKTGEGKSTAVANIVRELISSLNPATGKARRILVITNEEKREDFYNRITCLIMGWHYTNHDKFTEEQKKIFSKYIRLLSRVVTVIDDNHGGGSGMTTTLEGIEMIFHNLMRDGEFYDAVLMDYYQNINSSQKDPTLGMYEAQAKLAGILDRYKNIYPAPIVIMAQIKPAEAGEETSTPFEFRIKGSKQIMVPATYVMEMVAYRNEYRTAWITHKGRFSEGVGDTINTGYYKGRFVYHGPEFKQKVLKMVEDKNKKAMNRAAGTDFMKITPTPEPKQELTPEQGLKGEPVENPNAEVQKKPVVIEAIQYLGNKSKFEIAEWAIQKNGASGVEFGDDTLTILTLEGTMTASKGDFIIKGVEGEFYPCKPAIFAKTYEAVEE